jgi:hypothetical protein
MKRGPDMFSPGWGFRKVIDRSTSDRAFQYFTLQLRGGYQWVLRGVLF